MANKIKYGIKSLYYAVATIAADGTATYGTPVAVPGAVSISLAAQGETNPFYADDIVYYTSVSNTGYEGDLEVATFPDAFLKDILNYYQDANSVLVEDAGAEPVHFALMFEFAGDEKATRHVMYNCVATRPDTESNTKEESISPETETITITATSIHVAALNKDIVKSQTSASTATTAYNAWYTTVYTPTAAS